MMNPENKIGHRIIIVGSGGSGKSHLSRRLGDILGIEVHHLDKLYWLPGWVEREKDEFDLLCSEIYKKDSFIIDGNYMRTMKMRIEHADTMIWLDFSTFAAVRGVLHRIRTTRGRVRPDMGDGCPERFDPSFIKWIVNFRRKVRPKIVKVAEEALSEGKNVIVLKNRREVEEFVKSLGGEA